MLKCPPVKKIYVWIDSVYTVPSATRHLQFCWGFIPNDSESIQSQTVKNLYWMLVFSESVSHLLVIHIWRFRKFKKQTRFSIAFLETSVIKHWRGQTAWLLRGNNAIGLKKETPMGTRMSREAHCHGLKVTQGPWRSWCPDARWECGERTFLCACSRIWCGGRLTGSAGSWEPLPWPDCSHPS